MVNERLTEKGISALEDAPAVEVDPDQLSPSEYLRYIERLKRYIYDPDSAMREDAVRSETAVSNYADDYGYVDHLASVALDRLEELAHNPNATYLEKMLARGVASSPVALVFDTRRGHEYDLVTKDEVDRANRSRYLGEGDADNDRNLTDDQIDLLNNAYKNNHPNIDEYEFELWKARLRRRNAIYSIQEIKTRRAFQTEEQQLVNAGYLESSELYSDVTFLTALINHDISSANHRLWQLAYKISDEDEIALKPYSFLMRAYGEVIEQRADHDFYQSFIERVDVDYKAIQDHGMMYVPVWVSPNTVGFYEGTGQLVDMFDMVGATPTDPLSPQKVDLEALCETV